MLSVSRSSCPQFAITCIRPPKFGPTFQARHSCQVTNVTCPRSAQERRCIGHKLVKLFSQAIVCLPVSNCLTSCCPTLTLILHPNPSERAQSSVRASTVHPPSELTLISTGKQDHVILRMTLKRVHPAERVRSSNLYIETPVCHAGTTVDGMESRFRALL